MLGVELIRSAKNDLRCALRTSSAGTIPAYRIGARPDPPRRQTPAPTPARSRVNRLGASMRCRIIATEKRAWGLANLESREPRVSSIYNVATVVLRKIRGRALSPIPPIAAARTQDRSFET